MQPSSMTSTWATAAWSRNCSWFVTRSRVVPSSASTMHRSKRCAPTCASTAANGSSRSTRPPGFDASTARARATRAFWPPDSVRPFSPISVASPAGRTFRSCPRAAASSAAEYLRSSSSSAASSIPKRTFCRRVSLTTTGSCATYVRDGPDAATPPSGPSPGRASQLMAPAAAARRLLFPEPSGPTMAHSSPLGTSMVMDLSVGGWSVSRPQRKSRPLMLRATSRAASGLCGGPPSARLLAACGSAPPAETSASARKGRLSSSGWLRRSPKRAVTARSMLKAPHAPLKKAKGTYMKRVVARMASVSGGLGRLPLRAISMDRTTAAVRMGTVPASGQLALMLAFIQRRDLSSRCRSSCACAS
mmetsp:Transcript_96394/g.297232  ORF Transcript_96394/g.297232 Transcript_96394/m.297232 type:complete len:361 (-) Transcript_96394:902-1984(-)